MDTLTTYQTMTTTELHTLYKTCKSRDTQDAILRELQSRPRTDYVIVACTPDEKMYIDNNEPITRETYLSILKQCANHTLTAYHIGAAEPPEKK